MTEGSGGLSAFADVAQVIVDPLRFKLKLAIGEDAYASLRLKKRLAEIWEVGGAAATGAGLSASPVIASTFFASTATGGVIGWLGFGAAAATPAGWIAAAALATGGAYYGMVRLIRKFSSSRVETIPKFINTPLDLLGASLLDLIGGLSAKLALADGQVQDAERSMIAAHFVDEWGFDAEYVRNALALLFASSGEQRVKQLAHAFAQFVAQNPDCNSEIVTKQLFQFLRDVAESDGMLDEREELALDAVATIFETEAAITLTKLGKRVRSAVVSASTSRSVRQAVPRIA